jgi:proline racemase
MQMSQEARTHTVEALAKYMETVRTEAEKHPVVLLLDHPDVENVSFNLFAKAVDDALRKCEKAVEKLMQGGVNQETFGTARRYQDLSFTGMAAQIANSSRVSVWKVPFFMERALLVQPVRQANVVRRMMEYAAEVEGQGAIRMNLAFMGTDTAMMVAPAAGYIGVALALTWAIISLGRSIHEYTQLSDLYEASIDPAVQLLGDEHGPASKLWVVLDLFGLIV